jgi:hypothetical protein
MAAPHTQRGPRADASPETPERAGERPTIGLALGGAARGFAHIGVIRTHRQRHKPDVIVDTSTEPSSAAATQQAGSTLEIGRAG